MPDEHLSITTLVQICLDGLKIACRSLAEAEPNVRNKLPPGSMDESLGRLRIWAGNCGAHRIGRASLEYKLREASHIRDKVSGLLHHLRHEIIEAQEIISGQRVPWEDLPDSDSDSSKHGSQMSEDLPTELVQITLNMVDFITCLFRLSMAIRNPAPHDQFKASAQWDLTYFEPFDVLHVRNKFPLATESLTHRLGTAISRRRLYLRYREQHRIKMEQGLNTQPLKEELPVARPLPQSYQTQPAELASTVASSLPLPWKNIKASTIDLDLNNEFPDEMSQTSFASSNHDPSRLRPPSLSKGGNEGEPFECTLCFRITSVRHVREWNKHVYRDLQPYVCTFDECPVPDRIYESRHEWFEHELHAHRKTWECIEGCNKTFVSQSELREHLLTAHSDIVDDIKINDFVRYCERQVSLSSEADCPLCQQQMPSLNHLRRHLGKHHEELSLFALPSHLKEDDDETISQSSIAGNVQSMAESGKSWSPMSVVSEEGVLDLRSDDGISQEASSTSKQGEHNILSNRNRHSNVIETQFTDAKALLRFKPTIVQLMDAEALDRKSLNAYFGLHSLQLPGTISTWNELKQWHADRSNDVADVISITQLQLLQAMQFNTMLVNQEADFYFDHLVNFYDMQGKPGISELEIRVLDKPVTLRQIWKAVRARFYLDISNEKGALTEMALSLGFDNDDAPDAANSVKDIYNHYSLPFEEYLTLTTLNQYHHAAPVARKDPQLNSWEVKVSGRADTPMLQATLSMYATHVTLHSMYPGPLRIAQFHNIEYLETSNTIMIQETTDLLPTSSADNQLAKVVKKNLFITPLNATHTDEIKRSLSSIGQSSQIADKVRFSRPTEQSQSDHVAFAPHTISDPRLTIAIAQVKGIVQLPADQWCTIELHHGSLTIFGSVEGTTWHIFRGNVYYVYASGAQVTVQGWLEHNGSSPMLASITLLFREIHEAASVFAEIDYARNKTTKAQPAPWRPYSPVLQYLWKY